MTKGEAMNSSTTGYSNPNTLWVNEARTFRHPAGFISSGAEKQDFAGTACELALDAAGNIQRCDTAAAELFFASPEMLVGRHITKLIPELPLKPDTPGYNVAYATFCAARPVWLWFKAVDSAGCTMRLYVSFDAPKSSGAQMPQRIVLRLRDSMEAAAGLRSVALNGADPGLQVPAVG
jgi:hypothetical protein